jgi:hypothetical protein
MGVLNEKKCKIIIKTYFGTTMSPLLRHSDENSYDRRSEEFGRNVSDVGAETSRIFGNIK